MKIFWKRKKNMDEYKDEWKALVEAISLLQWELTKLSQVTVLLDGSLTDKDGPSNTAPPPLKPFIPFYFLTCT